MTEETAQGTGECRSCPWLAKADYHAALASALKAKHEGGSVDWWAEWHRTHCAAAEAATRAEAALADLRAAVEALADEWQRLNIRVFDPAAELRALVAQQRDGGRQ